jgi:hypothetical protein
MPKDGRTEAAKDGHEGLGRIAPGGDGLRRSIPQAFSVSVDAKNIAWLTAERTCSSV